MESIQRHLDLPWGAAPLEMVCGMVPASCQLHINLTYLGGAATCKTKSSSCTSSRSGITGISAMRGEAKNVSSTNGGSCLLLHWLLITFNVPATVRATGFG